MQQLAKFLQATGRRFCILAKVICHFFRKGKLGLKLAISRIEGKVKMSQNRPEADRTGVAAGLAASERPGDRQVAAMIPTP